MADGPINISAEYLKTVRGKQAGSDSVSAEDRSRAAALKQIDDKLLNAKTRSTMLDVSSSKAYSESVKKFAASIEALKFVTNKLKAASIDVGSDRLASISKLTSKAAMASSMYMAGTGPAGKPIFRTIASREAAKTQAGFEAASFAEQNRIERRDNIISRRQRAQVGRLQRQGITLGDGFRMGAGTPAYTPIEHLYPNRYGNGFAMIGPPRGGYNGPGGGPPMGSNGGLPATTSNAVTMYRPPWSRTYRSTVYGVHVGGGPWPGSIVNGAGGGGGEGGEEGGGGAAGAATAASTAYGAAKWAYRGYEYLNNAIRTVNDQYERLARASRVAGASDLTVAEGSFGKANHLVLNRELGKFYPDMGTAADVYSEAGLTGGMGGGSAFATSTRLANSRLSGGIDANSYQRFFGESTGLGITASGDFSKVGDILQKAFEKGAGKFLPPKQVFENMNSAMQLVASEGMIVSAGGLAKMAMAGAGSAIPSMRNFSAIASGLSAYKGGLSNVLGNPIGYTSLMADMNSKIGTINPTGPQLQKYLKLSGAGYSLTPAQMKAQTAASHSGIGVAFGARLISDVGGGPDAIKALTYNAEYNTLKKSMGPDMAKVMMQMIRPEGSGALTATWSGLGKGIGSSSRGTAAGTLLDKLTTEGRKIDFDMAKGGLMDSRLDIAANKSVSFEAMNTAAHDTSVALTNLTSKVTDAAMAIGAAFGMWGFGPDDYMDKKYGHKATVGPVTAPPTPVRGGRATGPAPMPPRPASGSIAPTPPGVAPSLGFGPSPGATTAGGSSAPPAVLMP